MQSELAPIEITSLSFVRDFRTTSVKPGERRKNFRCFWVVSPSGDYCADCVTGEKMALELIRYWDAASHRHLHLGASGMLTSFACDMPPYVTGIEVGFWSIIGAAAQAGSHHGEALAHRWERARESRAA